MKITGKMKVHDRDIHDQNHTGLVYDMHMSKRKDVAKRLNGQLLGENSSSE